MQQLHIHLLNGGSKMRDYEKPYIEDEDIELEDVIAASGTKDMFGEDEEDPFNVGA